MTYTKDEIDQLYQKHHQKAIKISQPAYTYWQLHLKDQVITAYTSGKVVFQTKGKTQPKKKANLVNIYPQAGSDEVGTGDYFGPIVVAAVIVDQPEPLIKLGIMDSKQMSDATIRKVGQQILAYPHSIQIVDNPTYNRLNDNMVQLKTKLHQHAYTILARKQALPKLCVVDQFVSEAGFYRYVDKIHPLHFETKAESHYLSVAAASVLARYVFLQEWDKLEDKLQTKLPKGAGIQVDEVGQQLVKQHGQSILKHIAKIHFANTERILVHEKKQIV